MSLAVLIILVSVQPNSGNPPLVGPTGQRVAERAISAAQATNGRELLADNRALASNFSGTSDAYIAPAQPAPDSLTAGAFAETNPTPLAEGYPMEGGSCGACGDDPCGGARGHACGHFGGLRARLFHRCYDPLVSARRHAFWGCDPGDMYPWSPCWAECDTNYYFRPYYWRQVFRQQEVAARWGASPQSPYTSDVFEQVYAELGIESAMNYEHLPRPEVRKQKPSDHFEPVDCD